jgi:peptide subunit release factor 1 (eRF1)
MPSRFLTLLTSGLHPMNGEPVDAAEDVADLAIQSALDQGASIEIVCSETAKAMLDERNIQLAAFLRY